MNTSRLRAHFSLRATRIRIFLAAVVLAMISCQESQADAFGEGVSSFEIEFVTIGDPGNAPDLDNNPRSYIGHPGAYPIGGLDYEYRIGKYEIAREQIEKANSLGDLGITMLDMTKVQLNLQIATANEPFLPATGISWYEAATFVNWLNASEGYTEAYKVRDGAFQVWEPNDEGYDSSNIFRNRQAHYFLPSDSEWYKAAFYDGKKDVYYHYATGSDTPPDRVARGTDEGTVVYHQRGPAPVKQAGGLSPYGTMGQSGNAWEWEETQYKHVNKKIDALRGLRSGDWGTDAEHVSADYRNPFGPEVENQLMSFGFRVASLAEPSALGDFNANGVFDAADIDRIVTGANNLRRDLTSDGVVNGDDRVYWVHKIAHTWFGDANLDGQFNNSDLLAVFQQGRYEDQILANAGWDSGDWNGDGDFDSSDLILAFQDNGYDRGPRPDAVVAVAVPEISGGALLLLVGIAAAARRPNARPEHS